MHVQTIPFASHSGGGEGVGLSSFSLLILAISIVVFISCYVFMNSRERGEIQDVFPCDFEF